MTGTAASRAAVDEPARFGSVLGTEQLSATASGPVSWTYCARCAGGVDAPRKIARQPARMSTSATTRAGKHVPLVLDARDHHGAARSGPTGSVHGVRGADGHRPDDGLTDGGGRVLTRDVPRVALPEPADLLLSGTDQVEQHVACRTPRASSARAIDTARERSAEAMASR
jgi:hypothetical protein